MGSPHYTDQYVVVGSRYSTRLSFPCIYFTNITENNYNTIVNNGSQQRKQMDTILLKYINF